MRAFIVFSLAGALAGFAPVHALTKSIGCGTAGTFGRRIERQIEVTGTTRHFILDVPKGIDAEHPAALLFDFHGFGHSGAGVWSVSEFRKLAESKRFVTAYPTGLPIKIELRGQSHTGPGWEMEAIEGNRDIAFTRAMIEEIGRQYCIDLDRVYATGFSNGAFFSSLLGCEMSDTFAAVAPVSGGGLRSACKPKRAVPILIHHGTKDDLITIDRARAGRDQWLEANGCQDRGKPAPSAPNCHNYDQCAAGVVYCEEDVAHRWPAQATGRIWSFFEARTRSVGRAGNPR